MESESVTQLLHQWRQGNDAALDHLAPLVYRELRRVAGGIMKAERPGHTLQPTALVHEAYMRLVEQDQPDWNSRTHFVAVAAQYMRQILVDHARERRSQKRGAGALPVTLDPQAHDGAGQATDCLALDDALRDLAHFDQRRARILELRYFGGLKQNEIAEVIGVHVNTVARELRLAEAWLRNQLT
ncbi:MAG TPA: sigma-70 family RNA polymerase sigma factor [Bryobacteraceae bacterium]|nr:sigma-70 family RNA polymerase sigma factor [Bryobacteraceae bacterium]